MHDDPLSLTGNGWKMHRAFKPLVDALRELKERRQKNELDEQTLSESRGNSILGALASATRETDNANAGNASRPLSGN